jgi:hypothetical protein
MIMRYALILGAIILSNHLSAQQIDCYKTTPVDVAYFDSLQGGATITKEKLLSAGKLKSLKPDFVVTRFTITIDGAVVDLDEKINDGNSFSGEHLS